MQTGTEVVVQMHMPTLMCVEQPVLQGMLLTIGPTACDCSASWLYCWLPCLRQPYAAAGCGHALWAPEPQPSCEKMAPCSASLIVLHLDPQPITAAAVAMVLRAVTEATIPKSVNQSSCLTVLVLYIQPCVLAQGLWHCCHPQLQSQHI